MPEPTETLAEWRKALYVYDKLGVHATGSLLAAVESVLALHVMEYDDASGRNRCRECGYEDWTEPDCPTVRAIESALGGGDDD